MFPNKFFPELPVRKIEMFDNNKISLILTKDPESQNCTKYIDITNAASYIRSGRKKRTRN